MAINRSRFRRNVDWDGPQVARRKNILSEAETWKKRFFIVLVIGLALIFLLLAALGIFYFKYTHLVGSNAGTDTAQTFDTTLTTYTNKDLKVALQYPADWEMKTKTATTDLDVLNIAFSKKIDAVAATFTLDVIKNQDSMTLDAWVKRFGVQNTETTKTQLAGHDAVVATFQSTSTGESQSVYYLSEGNKIYVIDSYQSAKNEVLKSALAEVVKSFVFTTTEAKTTEAPATPVAPTMTKNERVLLNSVVSDKNDSIFSFAPDGTDSKQLFSDAKEKVYYKNVGAVSKTSGTFFGYFGTTPGGASDGIYSVNLVVSTPALTAVKKGISPGAVRVSADGKTIAYLDGARGVAKKIVVITSAGAVQQTLSLSEKIVDFDLADDGANIAYVPVGAKSVFVVNQKGEKISTKVLTTKNVLRFDWIQGATDQFAFVVDAGNALSNTSELFFGSDASAKRLTSDSFLQDAPIVANDGKNVYYESYTANAPTKRSIWRVGVDGSNDTNIAKGKNQTLLGESTAF